MPGQGGGCRGGFRICGAWFGGSSGALDVKFPPGWKVERVVGGFFDKIPGK